MCHEVTRKTYCIDGRRLSRYVCDISARMSNNEGTTNDSLTLSPVWKSYRKYTLQIGAYLFFNMLVLFTFLVYHLQQEAPSAVAVPCASKLEQFNRPPYFDCEYHGSISNQEAKLLLQKDGQFLVRESGKSREHHTLSLRFNNELKHYRLVIKVCDRLDEEINYWLS